MPQYAVLTGPKTIELQNRESRKLESGQIRARVISAGICKTDIAIYSGDYQVPLPIVLGHEWIGEVVETASDDHSHLVGKKITAEINNTCLATKAPAPCRACMRGLPNHCMKRSVTGIVNFDGAFAEKIIVPAGAVFQIPENIPDGNAVFIEPLAAAIRTFELSPLLENDLVVIFGAGKLGILISIVAKSLKADVLLVSRTDKTKNFSDKFRINHLVTKNIDEVRDVVQQKTGGFGADFVIDATGDPDTISNALKIVRPRGIVSIKSTPGLPATNFDITKFVVDEITLQGTRCGSFEKAIEFLTKHKPDLSGFIAKTYPLSQISEALDISCDTPGKILIKP